MASDLEFEVSPQENGQALVPHAVTPMELLQSAINQNLDTDKLGKLLELQLRWEANQARKAFVEAMNAFKKDPPMVASLG